MPATLIASGISVVRGASVVLDDVSLTIAPGDRIGLVGPNGVGKSTLLAALAGEVALDSGSVSLAPPTAIVGLLPQEPERLPEETLLEFLGRRTGVAAASEILDAAMLALSTGDDGPDYDEALNRWLELGGADLETRAAAVCSELGLPLDLLAIETTALSGGQAARASLASVLLSRFEITLLDEPTNDLDFDGLRRLEAFVGSVAGALVIISHDREFLDRTVTTIIEVDQHSHGVAVYSGGYESYLSQRALARQQARDRYDASAEARSSLVTQAQRQREQSVRGAVRAQRRSSDNDRGLRGSRIEAATHAASRVRSIESRIDRLPAVAEPRKEWQLQLRIASAPRSGEEVATLVDAVIDRGSFRLGPVSLGIGWADRVAVTGGNGAGKSTLLAALLGRLTLVAGSQRLGSGVQVGEVDQARARFRGTVSVLDIAVTATDWPAGEVRTLFAKFGLAGDPTLRPSSALSPGERTRAGLALLQAVGVNCLVLDEPTNHLDLPAIEQLESALADYAGTLLLVSHDRRLLSAVSVTRRIEVIDGQVREIPLD